MSGGYFNILGKVLPKVQLLCTSTATGALIESADIHRTWLEQVHKRANIMELEQGCEQQCPAAKEPATVGLNFVHQHQQLGALPTAVRPNQSDLAGKHADSNPAQSNLHICSQLEEIYLYIYIYKNSTIHMSHMS